MAKNLAIIVFWLKSGFSIHIMISTFPILAGIIALFLIIAVFVRKEYSVQREVIIDAPVERVFDYIKYLKNWRNFNPRAMIDPAENMEFKGIDGTVGFIYAWTGNTKISEGEWEIKSLINEKKIDTEIRVEKPFAGVAYTNITTEPISPTQTKVVFSYASTLKYPLNILLPRVHNKIRKDIDLRLVALKNILEAKPFVPAKPKPPYLLGLLCLIPLFGAFVGAGILLFGIIKYRDKWFSIIGAAGILWTVAFYSTLIYFGTHSLIIKNGFKDISQTELNSLVKDIEYYKLIHGQYPDSLQQLLIDDKLAMIHDPIQGMAMKGDLMYCYRKIGNKYVVFSSGQDNIPNTQDDLFPKISATDTGKIGLIQNH